MFKFFFLVLSPKLGNIFFFSLFIFSCNNVYSLILFTLVRKIFIIIYCFWFLIMFRVFSGPKWFIVFFFVFVCRKYIPFIYVLDLFIYKFYKIAYFMWCLELLKYPVPSAPYKFHARSHDALFLGRRARDYHVQYSWASTATHSVLPVGFITRNSSVLRQLPRSKIRMILFFFLEWCRIWEIFQNSFSW